MKQLSVFSVERCIKPVGFGKIKHAQLHHFADASEGGYGTVTYIRMLKGTYYAKLTFSSLLYVYLRIRSASPPLKRKF